VTLAGSFAFPGIVMSGFAILSVMVAARCIATPISIGYAQIYVQARLGKFLVPYIAHEIGLAELENGATRKL
jgi:hypothetical protein